MSQTLRLPAAPAPVVHDDYCPVCGRPGDFCLVCGDEHDPARPHPRVPGEEVRFTRDDLAAVEREAAAWEGSREYEADVHGVRAHVRQLRALAHKLAIVLTWTG